MKPEAETTGRYAVPQVQGPPHPLRARVLGWHSEQGRPSGTTSLQCHLTGVIPRLPQGEKAWHQAVSVQHEAPLEGKGASGLRPAPVSDAFLLWLLSVLFPAQPGPRAHGLDPGPTACPARGPSPFSLWVIQLLFSAWALNPSRLASRLCQGFSDG